MKLLKDIGLLLSLEGAAQKTGRKVLESDLGFIEKAAIVFDKGQIVWVGHQKKLPKEFTKKIKKEIDVDGKVILPGLVECHTHLVFAGNRADEFEMRLRGASYQEISAKGGGIVSTMKKTRVASLAQLKLMAEKRLREFQKQGVTTVEVKSGYGLQLKAEIKQLAAVQNIKNTRVVRTFLGAHSKPPEFPSYEEYLNHLAKDVLPVVAKKKLAERVDVFIEKGFFPPEASKAYLQKAKELGFAVTVHAEQLSLAGGTQVGLDVEALSCDHVIQIDDALIAKMGKSPVTAVLLPAADLYMKCAYPPARKLIDAGARVALATDFNPGTSPTQNIQLVGLLARLEMGMSLPEVISAYTVGAAHALNRQNEVGSLSFGKKADFVIWDGEWSELFYEASSSKVDAVFFEGLPVFNAKQ